MKAHHLSFEALQTIGVTAVDDAHGELLQLYNRIVDACNHGETMFHVRERIRSFLLYARWHFRDEERYMNHIKYPALFEHKAHHDCLLQDAEDFINNLGESLFGEDTIAVTTYFSHWLSRHMTGHDQRLREFLAASSGSGQPFSSQIGQAAASEPRK
jgi:hemerythrin